MDLRYWYHSSFNHQKEVHNMFPWVCLVSFKLSWCLYSILQFWTKIMTHFAVLENCHHKENKFTETTKRQVI